MSSEIPKTVTWFKVYCGFMTLVYLLCAAGGVTVMLLDAETVDMNELEQRLVGSAFLVMGIGLSAPFIAAMVLKPQPWVWTYSLVLICVGLTSAACAPIGGPLLYFWFKPNVKRYFGRDVRPGI